MIDYNRFCWLCTHHRNSEFLMIDYSKLSHEFYWLELAYSVSVSFANLKSTALKLTPMLMACIRNKPTRTAESMQPRLSQVIVRMLIYRSIPRHLAVLLQWHLYSQHGVRLSDSPQCRSWEEWTSKVRNWSCQGLAGCHRTICRQPYCFAGILDWIHA